MKKPKVFISYAREDERTAKRIYKDLESQGVQAWLDKFSLLPGQNWKIEIEHAIRRSNYFIALLSSKSLSKRGYVQKELRKGLDILDEFPDSEIFLIPVRLDDCEPFHPRLGELQRVDLFPSYGEGLNQILKALKRNKNVLKKKDNSSLKKKTDARPSKSSNTFQHAKENKASPASIERKAELPKPSPSLQTTAETYLSIPFHMYSTEKQVLKQSGKSCVAPLINAILARIVRESQGDYLNQRLIENNKDDTILNMTYKHTMSMIIGDLIKKSHEIITEIGPEAFSILHNITVIENRQDNIRIISALLLLEERKPSNETIEAVAVAKRRQRDLLNEKGILEGGVETTLFWIYNYILFNSRTDPTFETKFLTWLRDRGYTFEEGLITLKQEAHELILNNLSLSKSRVSL